MEARDAGLTERLRRMAERALELARVRLELLGVELQAELLRLFGVLTALLLALLLGVAALLMLVFAALLWVPDGWRAPVGAGLGVAFLAGAGLCWWWARRALAAGRPFAASAAELARDQRAFGPDDAGGRP
ncbi:phage holin family protein [Roseateles sp. MS654]|uniref:phage holin family protein n=1 Tax=Roseateles sp. MS654 TaxID=3412685 RepID=UPI003C2F9370